RAIRCQDPRTTAKRTTAATATTTAAATGSAARLSYTAESQPTAESAAAAIRLAATFQASEVEASDRDLSRRRRVPRWEPIAGSCGLAAVTGMRTRRECRSQRHKRR